MKNPLSIILALVLLSTSLYSIINSSISFNLDLARGPDPWEHFHAVPVLASQFLLSNATAGGPSVILTPGVNPNDLPQNFLTCPGHFQLTATSAASWPTRSFSANSSYLLTAYTCQLPCPVALIPTIEQPVQWNTPAVLPCANDGVSRELMACTSDRARNVSTEIPEHNAFSVPEAGKANFKPYVGSPVYLNEPARAGVLCNGSTDVAILGTGTATPASAPYLANNNPYFFDINMPGPGTSFVAASARTLQCAGAVNNVNYTQERGNIKYFFRRSTTSSLPTQTQGAFNITVANPISCSAEFVSVNPTRLEDLGDPLLTNTTYEITVTVRNPNPDIYIQATGVDVIQPSDWSAAMGSTMPNGFFQDIAPNTNQLLRINLTTPLNEPIQGPVSLTIYFNSSTTLCNRAVCNSTLNLTLFMPPPQNCSAEFVSVNPSRLEDLADPLLTNTSYEINVTVRNPNSILFIQATGVDVIQPSDWGAAMGSNMPNGFFQNIAPLTNQLLRINLTTPLNEPIQGPVNLIIYFNASFPGWNVSVCNSTLNLTLFNPTTFDDLAQIWVANASVPLNKTFDVVAVTYNRGSGPVPSTTNTSVILDGAPARYYPVPAGLLPASDPVPPDKYPRPDYVSRTYQMVCAFAHPIVVIANADWNNQLNEIDENNNRAVAVIQCGRSLMCPDYT